MMMDKLSLAFDDPAMNALLKGSGQSGEFEDTALTLSGCAIAAPRPESFHRKISDRASKRSLVAACARPT